MFCGLVLFVETTACQLVITPPSPTEGVSAHHFVRHKFLLTTCNEPKGIRACQRKGVNDYLTGRLNCWWKLHVRAGLMGGRSITLKWNSEEKSKACGAKDRNDFHLFWRLSYEFEFFRIILLNMFSIKIEYIWNLLLHITAMAKMFEVPKIFDCACLMTSWANESKWHPPSSFITL